MNCLRLSVGSDLDLGLSRDLEAEMRLLEVELCTMENVWRDWESATPMFDCQIVPTRR